MDYVLHTTIPSTSGHSQFLRSHMVDDKGLEEIFCPSDCNTALTFWLGRVSDNDDWELPPNPSFSMIVDAVLNTNFPVVDMKLEALPAESVTGFITFADEGLS